MILVGRYQEMESQGKRALVIHCSRSSLHRWHLIDLLTLQSQQWFATWNCNSSPLSGKITKIYNLHFIMTWDPPHLNFEQFQWYPHDYRHVPVGKLSSCLQGLRVSHQHRKWQLQGCHLKCSSYGGSHIVMKLSCDLSIFAWWREWDSRNIYQINIMCPADKHGQSWYAILHDHPSQIRSYVQVSIMSCRQDIYLLDFSSPSSSKICITLVQSWPTRQNCQIKFT